MAAIKAGLNAATLKAYPDGWEQPTGAEIRLVMNLAGLTGSKAAALTGNDDRTVRRWVSDDRKISYSAWAILLAGAGMGLIFESSPAHMESKAPGRAGDAGNTISSLVTAGDFTIARQIAAQWFADKPNQERDGYVVVLNGVFDGWTATISKLSNRKAGSIAVNSKGKSWLAHGVSESGDACSWTPIA